MNRYISWLFRAIPLLMGCFCLGMGLFIREIQTGTNATIASNVLIGLVAICIALYTTAATIIRQILKEYTNFAKILFPLIGYTVSAITILTGLKLMSSSNVGNYVSGHIVLGIGLIATCVSTVATSSTRFLAIAKNNKSNSHELSKEHFSKLVSGILIAIPIICTVVAEILAFYLLFTDKGSVPRFTAGHVLFGLGLVCFCLIFLVMIIVLQINNQFNLKSKWNPLMWAAIAGAVNLFFGLYVLFTLKSPAEVAPAWVLMALGMVCWSICSKILLLTLIWHHEAPLANRIPLIPVFTCMACLFAAAFLFEMATVNNNFFVPAHVVAGLGGVCFTLFSIVSILESGATE